MATTLVALAGTLVWPELLSPQATTVPLPRKATLCHPPAASAITFVALLGTVVCPESSEPHAATAPLEVAARL